MMLVSAYFSLKSEDRLYVFNPENVLYMDPEGVLFVKDVYRQFAVGEYENVMAVLSNTIDNVKV
tara:strand:+ start:941 stop:1132 length:192 start_codon:yes stop_codon:yes gene_type:complete